VWAVSCDVVGVDSSVELFLVDGATCTVSALITQSSIFIAALLPRKKSGQPLWFPCYRA
jgi:hypothetical protein